MNTINFLKEAIEEIKPNMVLGDKNTPLDFLDLTIGEFVKLRDAVYNKYGATLRINYMFECVGVVELSRKIDSLILLQNNLK